MASMSYSELVRLLREAGCTYVREARKGGHELWHNPVTNRKFSVPKRLKGEGTLHEILKAAGMKRPSGKSG